MMIPTAITEWMNQAKLVFLSTLEDVHSLFNSLLAALAARPNGYPFARNLSRSWKNLALRLPCLALARDSDALPDAILAPALACSSLVSALSLLISIVSFASSSFISWIDFFPIFL